MIHNKFWQGFFAIAPIALGLFSVVIYILFVLNLLSDIEMAEAKGEVTASMILGNVAWFIGFIMFLILVSLGSLLFFIVHAVQNPNLKESNLLIVWILLFIFIGGLGQLVYWLVEIVSKKPKDPYLAQ